MCKSLGLVKAGMISIDSTKLAANASMSAFKTAQEYQEWEQTIDKQIKDIIEEAERNDAKEDLEHSDLRGDEIPSELRDLHTLKSRIKQVREQLQDKARVNFTDTDAKVIKSRKGFGVNYNCQTAVDQNGIILAGYASNNASDKGQLIGVLAQSENNTGLDFDQVVADAGYASYDNYEAIDLMGKTAYIPDQEYKQKKQANPYHKTHFTYNPKADTYICPEGKPLSFDSIYNNKRSKQHSRLYKGTQCDLCAKRAECTKGKSRYLHQELREGLRQKVRDRLNTLDGKLKMRQRMHLIESRFGHMKFNLKYDRLMLRGLNKVDAEYKLICTAMNLLKIFKQQQRTMMI